VSDQVKVSYEARRKPILSWQDAYLEAETEIAALKAKLQWLKDRSSLAVVRRWFDRGWSLFLGGIAGGFLAVLALAKWGF
jgi:hypothetical protein